MYRLRIGLQRCINDLVDDEIALVCRRRPYFNCLISEANVTRTGIGFRVDSNGFNTELLCGTNDSAGNFTTVGDEYFVKLDYRLYA